MQFIYEILIIISVFIMIVYPILIFLPWYTWWNKYDPQRQYSCFSLAAIGYYIYNNPIYRIYNFITPNPSQFKHDFWVVFIMSIMAGEAVEINPQGVCTPKTLCKSLVPDTPPIGLLPGKFGGVWPTSESDWKELLLAWTGMTQVPVSDQDWKPDMTTWENENNFLVPWGITPYSPAVIGFITGHSTFNGDVIYPTVLNPLLGIYTEGIEAGGWMGFLQQGDNFSGLGMDEANRAIWSNEVPPAITNGAKQACSAAGIVSGGIGMAMGGAFAGSAIAGAIAGGVAGSEVPVIGNIIGAIIGGIIGAIGGGLLGAWSGKCFG